MTEFKHDTRTPTDYKEIAQELFDKLVSVDWGYTSTGILTADIQHRVQGYLLYFKYGMNSEREPVCHVSVQYVNLFGAHKSFIGSVILKRKGG